MENEQATLGERKRTDVGLMNATNKENKTEKFCQLKETDGHSCGSYVGIGSDKLFTIDGLVLCANHTEDYIHQKISPFSLNRKKFDKLLNRMIFTE